MSVDSNAIFKIVRLSLSAVGNNQSRAPLLGRAARLTYRIASFWEDKYGGGNIMEFPLLLCFHAIRLGS